MIQCSQCGSTVLQLTCNPAGNGWDVHCGKGHPYAPVPGYEIKVDLAPAGQTIPQGEAAGDCTFPGCRASASQQTIYYDMGLDGGRCGRHKGMLGAAAGIPDGQA